MKKQEKINFILLIMFVMCIIIVAEMIGYRSIIVSKEGINLFGWQVTNAKMPISLSLGFLPLVFAVIMGMTLGMKKIRVGILKHVYSKENVAFAGRNLILIMLPLMARYGVSVAPQLGNIFARGPIFLAQELGNVGTVLIGLPIAIAIGLKREAIGVTLGLGREGELAYISEKYTLDSEEGRGVLSIYIIGTVFGALFFSLIAPILLNIGFDFRALAMASGVGSASMMTGSSTALIAALPEHKEVIQSYAAASQLLTSFLGTYTMVFVAVPLQRFMYNKLTKGGTK